MWHIILLVWVLIVGCSVVHAGSGDVGPGNTGPFNDPQVFKLLERGIERGGFNVLDCQGVGITCTQVGDIGTITVSGGSGSGSSTPDILSREFRAVVIRDSNAESVIGGCIIPGNSLGIDRSVHFRVLGGYVNRTGAVQTIRIRITFGVVEVYNDVTINAATSANERGFDLDMILANDGVTNLNYIAGKLDIGGTGAATSGSGDLGSDEILATAMITQPVASAVDTTVNQRLTVFVQLSTAAAGAIVRRDLSVCTLN